MRSTCPPARACSVTAAPTAEIGVASAPGSGARPARLIEPAAMKRFARGKGAQHALRVRHPAADRAAPITCWWWKCARRPATRRAIRRTSTTPTIFPPKARSRKRTTTGSNPAQGFAFQRVYTDDRSLDESLAVEDHDVVMVPRGYHPVVVPYGYESYYLNVMAGPKREWHFKNDPVHEWMLKK